MTEGFASSPSHFLIGNVLLGYIGWMTNLNRPSITRNGAWRKWVYRIRFMRSTYRDILSGTSMTSMCYLAPTWKTCLLLLLTVLTRRHIYLEVTFTFQTIRLWRKYCNTHEQIYTYNTGKWKQFNADSLQAIRKILKSAAEIPRPRLVCFRFGAHHPRSFSLRALVGDVSLTWSLINPSREKLDTRQGTINHELTRAKKKRFRSTLRFLHFSKGSLLRFPTFHAVWIWPWWNEILRTKFSFFQILLLCAVANRINLFATLRSQNSNTLGYGPGTTLSRCFPNLHSSQTISWAAFSVTVKGG